MKKIKQKTAVGKYMYIRSSESRDAMTGWSKVEYDVKSDRWYEMWTRTFSDYQETEKQQATDDKELEEFVVDHIQAPVRQSVCEMFFDNGGKPAQMHFRLKEMGSHEVWQFSFGAICAEKKKCEKLMKIIHTWHSTGHIKMRDLKRQGCYMLWDKCC